MKLYKYWKVFLGIGILFTLSIFSVPKVSFAMIPNIIFAILFLYLGITQKKKAFADPDYVEEMERRKQEKALAKMSHQERYKDAKQIHTKIKGVTFDNEDGSSRQSYLSHVKNKEQLFLKEYSYNGTPAFYVCRKNGECLGNLSSEIATKIKTKYGNNEKLVFVEEIYIFDRNEFYDNNNKEDYIYYCKIVIYIP